MAAEGGLFATPTGFRLVEGRSLCGRRADKSIQEHHGRAGIKAITIRIRGGNYLFGQPSAQISANGFPAQGSLDAAAGIRVISGIFRH
jgi:hypothetical protein